MSMVIDLPGGGAAFDTSTIGHRVRDPRGWGDSVEYVTNLEQVPGRVDSLDLGGGPTALPRQLFLVGHMKAATRSALEANFLTLGQKLKIAPVASTPEEIEISMAGNADIIAVGRCLGIEHGTIAPAFDQVAFNVTIRIECKDPRRYDISSGRPGVALP